MAAASNGAGEAHETGVSAKTAPVPAVSLPAFAAGCARDSARLVALNPLPLVVRDGLICEACGLGPRQVVADDLRQIVTFPGATSHHVSLVRVGYSWQLQFLGGSEPLKTVQLTQQAHGHSTATTAPAQGQELDITRPVVLPWSSSSLEGQSCAVVLGGDVWSICADGTRHQLGSLPSSVGRIFGGGMLTMGGNGALSDHLGPESSAESVPMVVPCDHGVLIINPNGTMSTLFVEGTTCAATIASCGLVICSEMCISIVSAAQTPEAEHFEVFFAADLPACADRPIAVWETGESVWVMRPSQLLRCEWNESAVRGDPLLLLAEQRAIDSSGLGWMRRCGPVFATAATASSPIAAPGDTACGDRWFLESNGHRLVGMRFMAKAAGCEAPIALVRGVEDVLPKPTSKHVTLTPSSEGDSFLAVDAAGQKFSLLDARTGITTASRRLSQQASSVVLLRQTSSACATRWPGGVAVPPAPPPVMLALVAQDSGRLSLLQHNWSDRHSEILALPRRAAGSLCGAWYESSGKLPGVAVVIAESASQSVHLLQQRSGSESKAFFLASAKLATAIASGYAISDVDLLKPDGTGLVSVLVWARLTAPPSDTGAGWRAAAAVATASVICTQIQWLPMTDGVAAPPLVSSTSPRQPLARMCLPFSKTASDLALQSLLGDDRRLITAWQCCFWSDEAHCIVMGVDRNVWLVGLDGRPRAVAYLRHIAQPGSDIWMAGDLSRFCVLDAASCSWEVHRLVLPRAKSD
jgi:hypothetical protein